MIIGIDNGNANTKTTTSCFTSGIVTYEVKPPMADELILWNDKYYSLSSKVNIYMRDKTEDETCFILTLFGIAKEILARGKYKEEEISIDLAVGLPPEHFGKLHNKFASYFTKYGNPLYFSYNDKPFNINLHSIKVFPQGFAAVATQTNKFRDFSQFFIVDVGGYTVDTLLMTYGKPDLTYCYSLELGIITMNRSLIHRVNSKYDIRMNDQNIKDILEGNPTIFEDDIIQMVKEETKTHTNKILNSLREESIDLKANPVIFVGGGAKLLQEFFITSDKVKKAEFIPEINANAFGYEVLREAQIKRELLKR